MIAANTFGSGVEDILDLSGNNNPFSQATPSSRGAWFREPKTGRRNLLTFNSETLTSWTLVNDSGTASVVGNVITFGASNLDRVLFSSLSLTSGVNYVSSVTMSGTGQVRLILLDGLGTIVATTTVNLTTTPTRYSATAVSGATGNFGGIILRNNTAGTPSSVTFVNTQFETGSTPTAYQRVTTAFDVTEQGQRDCYGVRFDSVDDGYGTSSIDFSANDTISVFAAFRKLGDLATGTVVELTGNLGNPGAFGVLAPSSAGANNLQFRSTGSAISTTASGVAGPVTYVGSFFRQISTDTNIMRLNGTQVATSATDQGTGNNTTGVLNLGFRNGGASNFLNGDLYALIVAGGSYPLSTIQRVERILSRITPTVNL